jgi:hypothetical protein
VGYWIWGKPLANLVERSDLVAALARPFAASWAQEMAYRVGYVNKGSKFGSFLSATGEKACYWLGKTLLGLNLVSPERLAPEGTIINSKGV